MKTVIITGANGNLGVATAKKFLDEGYIVVAIDGKDDHLEFALNNTNFEFHSIDLTNEEKTAEFIKSTVTRHGKIDAALMLVGGFAMGTVNDTNGADILKQFSLNFETAYFVAQPLHKHMQENGYGRLVFIGARPAINPAQGKALVAYALTKSLLFKLAEFINEENKGTNVVASVVVPSTIDTAINRKSMPDVNPADWVKPEQLADILEFICSEKGSVIREPVYKVYNNA
ncbi:SDR family NAD(P)-dependent oxidoreductase [Panacibacter ginsenosidivorans]|uniref:SDR family NAD(P)-dependent oxidoreductase n=1 Tax=Panacibacter ginsenosidivorans TaxID=1813871 RepID=A0A5B8VBN9_9BACT|nr:SDR family NAD(P)-dependent oxidoreductase [Panacibacter ginsenosidivorans]QEC68937.1 SDR family NAD(P)-dependent oxidoreductase [Panacibacter ginsenosidivorans]